MLNVSGAIKWIIEVVNLEISYQFYFGSLCSNWEFDFFSFRIRRSQGTRRKELRAQFIFKAYTAML